MANSFHFAQAPGHRIRRVQQLAVAIFMDETAGFDVTPVQFAILSALIDDPGKDQITLSGRVALDPATLGSVIGRLIAKGLVLRMTDPNDRRCKLLRVSPKGEQTVLKMKHVVELAQKRILSPLNVQEQSQLTMLLDKLLAGHGDTEHQSLS